MTVIVKKPVAAKPVVKAPAIVPGKKLETKQEERITILCFDETVFDDMYGGKNFLPR